jgi:sodium-dependent dicarboxylate transporter 2/3/5
MGPASRAEWVVGGIAATTAAAWLTRPLLQGWIPGISDAGIAMSGALLLFLAPPDPDGTPIMTWDEVEELPWGLLILFGGGLSLAAGIQGSGLAAWIGSLMTGLASWPSLLVIGLVAGVVVYLTEITSNTATAATFVPIAAAVALGAGLPPFELAAAVALAASAAFMMPVATAPNAIVYGSGLVPIRRMVAAGFWLNLAFVVLVAVAVRLLGGFASPG